VNRDQALQKYFAKQAGKIRQKQQQPGSRLGIKAKDCTNLTLAVRANAVRAC